MIYAMPKDLSEWGGSTLRGRWDYLTDDHSIKEILAAGSAYFARCLDLAPGDEIYCRDANHDRVVFIVNQAMQPRGVCISIDVRCLDQAVLGDHEDYVIQYRGPRKLHCIYTKGSDDPVEQGIRTKQEAEIRVAQLRDGEKAAA